MPTPREFMLQYRDLQVPVGVEDSASMSVCGERHVRVELKKYFMMNWIGSNTQRTNFNLVTAPASSGGTQAQRSRAIDLNHWFRTNRESIQTAAMGKGRPQDYVLALQWAVLSGQISNPAQSEVQKFCDQHLGIDCSGFATNYLMAAGKRPFS